MLVNVVSAMRGTRAAEVFEKIKKRVKDEGIPFEFVLDTKCGLFLEEDTRDKYRSTFSLKYREEGELKIVSIGSHLPDIRVIDAANQIFAMILRGLRSWTDVHGFTSMSAYGSVTNPGRDVLRRERRHRKEAQRKAGKRRELTLGHMRPC